MLSEILVLGTLYVRSLCRRFFVLGLGFLALISIAPPHAAAQNCSITPSFQAVKAGDCVQFTAQGCSDWSLNGVGTLDQSGRYCAPPTVFVQNYSKGSQILPNNFGANAYIGNLPVHPNTWWLTRIATAGGQGSQHDIKLGGGPRYNKGFYTNMCDQNTPLQMMHSVFPRGRIRMFSFPRCCRPMFSSREVTTCTCTGRGSMAPILTGIASASTKTAASTTRSTALTPIRTIRWYTRDMSPRWSSTPTSSVNFAPAWRSNSTT